MQGYCHNPTSADMTPDQFDTLLDIFDALGIIPWIDLAYLGFAQSWDADTGRRGLHQRCLSDLQAQSKTSDGH